MDIDLCTTIDNILAELEYNEITILDILKYIIFIVLSILLAVNVIKWVKKYNDYRKEQLRIRQQQLQEQLRLEKEREDNINKSVKLKYLKEALLVCDRINNSIYLSMDSVQKLNKLTKEKAIELIENDVKNIISIIESSKLDEKIKYLKLLKYSDISYVKEMELSYESQIQGKLNTLIITAFYRSPAGRNYYDKQFITSLQECQDYYKDKINILSNISKCKDIDRCERSKLTPGLRYDILKRDNYRCQICGRTADDGVTLEVDHKIPISKGGLTEESNLWTLCRDCNRGKSDKYYE